MKLKIMAVAVFAMALPAMAQERPVEYSEKIVPISEWSGPDRDVLGLFRGYTDPVLTYKKDGVVQTTPAKLIIYQTQVRTLVNKPASQINLASLIRPEVIQKFDNELKHRPIGGNDLMPSVAGHGPVPNFKWCADPTGQPFVKLADYEQPITYLKPDHKLCSDSARSVCLESCLYFSDSTWQKIISSYNNAKSARGVDPSELKDLGIGMQMEVRYFVSEAEYGQNLRALTGLNTPVRGVVEINIFYFNQVFQFGKIVAVFQEAEKNSQQTVLTSLNAVGVREKTWDKGFLVLNVGRVIRGQMIGFNTSKGLTAGVPTFTKDITKSIATILEQ